MHRGLHEDLGSHTATKTSSDRSFGLWFALFALLVGLQPLRSAHRVRGWALIVAAAFMLAAIVAPKVLHPLNRVWTSLGLLLGKVVNPIVMGVVFLLAVTPNAVILRLLGKDLLRLRRDPAADSYWIPRDPPGPDPASMSRQF